MTPSYTNSLIRETSPYLLQHAHNPVDWYAWNEETLTLAKSEQKPILVSIGYASCHWCHVMERESFEDAHVAQFMNKHFINIKVDREERPDIDHWMMQAVQAMGIPGGWPLHVFLTPDLQPFYGGTYFPPQPIYKRNSWLQILQIISEAWVNKREEISTQANQLFTHLKNIQQYRVEDEVSNVEDVTKMLDHSLRQADIVWGGWGRAPKFPSWPGLNMMLSNGVFFHHDDAIMHVKRTMRGMLFGGIYDQVGGGIARYSTDEKWLVPHFEKMLYDNAHLLMVLSDLFKVAEHPIYERYIRHTYAFIEREMLADEGLYYASMDADVEGNEGEFYVWKAEELKEILGEAYESFAQDFGVKEEGNWEETNVLWMEGVEEEEVLKQLDNWEQSLQLLLTVRDKRKRPLLDHKFITSWNGMMVVALCKMYAAFGEEEWKLRAKKLVSAMERKLQNESGWLHVDTGSNSIPAFLEDYAWLAKGYWEMYGITAEEQYLQKGKKILEIAEKEMRGEGLWYFSPKEGSEMNVCDRFDQPTASGNSLMAENLIVYGRKLANKDWEDEGRRLVRWMEKEVWKYPDTYGHWAYLSGMMRIGLQEITVEGVDFNTEFSQFLKIFLPIRILHFNIGGQKKSEEIGRTAENELKFTICNDFGCHPPLGKMVELKNFIGKLSIRNST